MDKLGEVNARTARRAARNGGEAARTAELSQRAEPRVLRELLGRIRSRGARIGVIGQGYVGLPLATLFAAKGFPVLGFDVDEAKVAALRAGRSHIFSVPSPKLAALRAEGSYDASSDLRRLAEMDAIIACVPTPLAAGEEPDLSFVESAAEACAAVLRRGQLIVLESTSYPGTTRELFLPRLEAKGLRCGGDFFLAFSPEREDPGNKEWNTETIPKVVGAMDEPSLKAARELYSRAVRQVVPVSSCETAEAAKLLENIFRCVNIALVNELKVCFDKMGIDVWEVIAAAKTKPFGFMPFYPGPGLGGHCIPVDPFYLSWKARRLGVETRFIQLAGQLNGQMPFYAVDRLEQALERRGRTLRGAEVLVLGLSYKKDSDDPRESPSFKILDALALRGARTAYNDPYIRRFPAPHGGEAPGVPWVELSAEQLARRDAVLIATDHSAYDFEWIARHARLVLDTRNACRSVNGFAAKIVRA